MASVTFDHVIKRFGDDMLAVNDLDLQIADGEFMVLVGPSGCGKTTALRCLAGLEEISEGSISIGQRVVNQVPAKDRNIAMVFQSYALYPHMTVFDNLAFGLRLMKTPKSDIRRRVEEAAKILDIGHLLDRKPRALSGGQRQRVALGRAIVREPDVFLMDEPLSNLDAKLRVQTRAEILRLQKRLGTTTVYVTHDQIEAMTMGDRIAVMREGVLQQVGSPQALYESPRNIFVAAFIGSPAMNFATVRVEDGRLALGEEKLELAGSAARLVAQRPSGSSLVIGFRPEHMSLAVGAPPTSVKIPATVDVVEYLGHEELVHAQTNGHEMIVLSEPHPSLRPGANVEFAVPVENVHLFDPETEERLFGHA
jgi:multiple sugar transport system ATP-binding protein